MQKCFCLNIYSVFTDVYLRMVLGPLAVHVSKKQAYI